ncbi:hypothetical protein SETIT_4G188100v2 [Setaria italica]|uniref:Uncharacterized protein n=3 Tax=Setaria TaxID=4554 RepID=A0A368PLL0_SETIT|nr:hypothetical protein SETIT_1G158000v2 [Setaria italica]RCV22039.1 hypothetical protein SETIT_4G188100v2 [Setaria italica]TKW18410.1 hypothetical protein SEVIR_5G428900v2 [Setaria viridis]TKW23729.1 hypothetical protein SEVIR_3G006300v2 [Setaria viridis]
MKIDAIFILWVVSMYATKFLLASWTVKRNHGLLDWRPDPAAASSSEYAEPIIFLKNSNQPLRISAVMEEFWPQRKITCMSISLLLLYGLMGKFDY